MNFFAELPAIDNFLEFDNSSFYKPVPNDWWIIITDIQGSTDAVARGLFKEVNMAGAACVVAIAKSKHGLMIPFVFGGDGATALIPPDSIEASLRRLKSTQAVIKQNYGLNMRVGYLQVGEISNKGFDFLVARYQLPAGPSLAFFKGSGFDEAERLVKSGVGLLQSESSDIDPDVLEGLSCRWRPVQNERGRILTILVKEQPNCKNPKILQEVAQKIHEFVDLDAPPTHPIKATQYKHVSLWRAINLERALRNQPFFSKFSLSVVFQMLFTVFARATGYRTENVDMREYALHVNEHSDHKKFDSTLRMVIDCSATMVEKIRSYLEGLHAENGIFYGLHESDDALLTCYVESTQKGKHIHFVDGGGGGYTSAAKGLKKQIKEISQKS